jgi:hypothetical protein
MLVRVDGAQPSAELCDPWDHPAAPGTRRRFSARQVLPARPVHPEVRIEATALKTTISCAGATGSSTTHPPGDCHLTATDGSGGSVCAAALHEHWDVSGDQESVTSRKTRRRDGSGVPEHPVVYHPLS